MGQEADAGAELSEPEASEQQARQAIRSPSVKSLTISTVSVRMADQLSMIVTATKDFTEAAPD